MKSSAFLHFLFLLVFKHRSKHIAVFLIATLMIALLSSVFFLSASLEKEALFTLENQPDFIVQKIVEGKSVPLDAEMADNFRTIPGISRVTPRVFGRYYLPDFTRYFLIVGIDLFDEQTNAALRKLSEEIDPEAFLDKPRMIIGAGVATWLKNHYFPDYYDFRLPDGEAKRVEIYRTLPKESQIVSNDVVIMPVDLAREILNMEETEATDIAIEVPNDAERPNIRTKLLLANYDTRIIAKTDLRKAYRHLFNYKGGIFLMLFLVAMATFMLLLYQRYNMINTSDRKEIGILRAVGWSIRDVLALKILESFTVALFAYLTGLLLAWGYTFILQAPGLRNLFLGFENLPNEAVLHPVWDGGVLFSLFLFFMIPFLGSVLIPVWKIAITDANEAMR
ncbi:MAG: ABC transporter permease [Campylobacteraceae bacterium 4484_4]|nr:MAG: ABC transporter permease [Campylobacteraceae bacterium 4484_4]